VNSYFPALAVQKLTQKNRVKNTKRKKRAMKCSGMKLGWTASTWPKTILLSTSKTPMFMAIEKR
jgi:hypothetical protein